MDISVYNIQNKSPFKRRCNGHSPNEVNMNKEAIMHLIGIRKYNKLTITRKRILKGYSTL